MFDERLVRRFEFPIELVRYIDGMPNHTLNKLVIHPIEVGNKLEFRGESGTNFLIPVGNIVEVNTTDQTRGKFDRKNLLIEIEFKSDNVQSLAFNVEDNYIESILTKTLKPQEAEYWDTVELQYIMDGNVVNTKLYYTPPFLSDGEELLWANVKTEGINYKHLRWLEALTNFRAIYYDFDKHECGRIPLNFVDDVTVKNRQDSTGRFGEFTAASGKWGVSEGGKVGDVWFMKDGNPFVTFSRVSNPDGIADLARAVIKKLFAPVRTRKAQLPMAGEKPAVTDYKCSYCGNINPEGSLYCSKCGYALR